MALKHMQRWSTSFKIREIQIKMTRGCNFLHERLAKVQQIVFGEFVVKQTFSSLQTRKQKPLGAANTVYEISNSFAL